VKRAREVINQRSSKNLNITRLSSPMVFSCSRRQTRASVSGRSLSVARRHCCRRGSGSIALGESIQRSECGSDRVDDNPISNYAHGILTVAVEINKVQEAERNDKGPDGD